MRGSASIRAGSVSMSARPTRSTVKAPAVRSRRSSSQRWSLSVEPNRCPMSASVNEKPSRARISMTQSAISCSLSMIKPSKSKISARTHTRLGLRSRGSRPASPRLLTIRHEPVLHEPSICRGRHAHGHRLFATTTRCSTQSRHCAFSCRHGAILHHAAAAHARTTRSTWSSRRAAMGTPRALRSRPSA